MRRPTPKRVLGAAVLSLVFGLAIVAVVWPGWGEVEPFRTLKTLALIAAGAILIFGPMIWIGLRMADWSSPESEAEFEQLVQRSERIAAGEESDWDAWEDDDEDDDDWGAFDPYDEEDFQQLVRGALDDLPAEFYRALDQVPVVVSNQGRWRRAYGLYQGATYARRDDAHARIVIFRDTLLRDFGHDPDLLRAQVTRTVRHEIAHHFGWDEQGVRDLGL